MQMPKSATQEKIAKEVVVVFSGGQDSTTCLYLAKRDFEIVHAITFDYGQRHATEIEAAKAIANLAGVKHVVVDLKCLGVLSASALTRPEIDVTCLPGQLPSTFTPGRNLVFLTLAASYAISHNIDWLVTGVCQTDYSGYPDCRYETMNALEETIRLGNDRPNFHIYTPLMALTKAETVDLAYGMRTGFGPYLGAWDALAWTVTCYHGKRPGCGECPACVLRAKGFAEAGRYDPAVRA